MEDRGVSHNLVITCAPHPNPVETIADGGDHDPSDLRATTRPVPSLYVRNAPAFITVNIASPLAPLRTACGIDFSGFIFATCIKKCGLLGKYCHQISKHVKENGNRI
jgi:hypothetical protein